MAALRIVTLIVLMSALVSAQSQSVTITEPGVYKISDLFKASDVVALVKIVSGDTESYDHAVYKGEVIQSFKGMPRGAAIYFGPFVGEKLGWEYVLFPTECDEADHSENNGNSQLWNGSLFGGFQRRVLINGNVLRMRV